MITSLLAQASHASVYIVTDRCLSFELLSFLWCEQREELEEYQNKAAEAEQQSAANGEALAQAQKQSEQAAAENIALREQLKKQQDAVMVAMGIDVPGRGASSSGTAENVRPRLLILLI